MYVVKINGIKYEVENGVYNPPLPQDRVERDEENIKEIIQTQQCPGLRTDTNWHAGRGTLLSQMEDDPVWTKHLVKEARKQGYNPGANDVYLGQMADSVGDPKAWFKPGEGRSELVKRAKASGKGVEAPGVSVQPRKYEERKGPQLSEAHTQRFMQEYKAQGTTMSDPELRAHVKKTHGKAL